MANPLLAALTFALILAGCGPNNRAEVVRQVSESHVAANAPEAAEFDRLLKRDITLHLEGLGYEGDALTVDLLRRGPTQTGISWPKYYAWVQLTKDSRIIVEGALRLAAIDGNRFDVTHFLTVSQLTVDPGRAAEVFPAPLLPEIQARAKQ